MGSCFSENIGDKFSYFKFQVAQNPFGILFHPLAIENLIQRACKSKPYTVSEVFELYQRWYSFDSHSSMMGTSNEDLVRRLNETLLETRAWLKKASHIIITLGTSWAYRHTERDVLVANCHKVPQNQFEKKLLGIDEVVGSLRRILGLVRGFNKNVECIFTISPVRHLKDGFVENQVSKSHLIAAIHQLPKENTNYFPSYEIVMDELRDYRFYNSDMVHPNQLAIDYIWEKFKSVWISENAYDLMENVAGVQKGLKHKPFNPETTCHKKFLAELEGKIQYLQKAHPYINFDR